VHLGPVHTVSNWSAFGSGRAAPTGVSGRRGATPVREGDRFDRLRDAVWAQAGELGVAVSLDVVCQAAVTHLHRTDPAVVGAAVSVPCGPVQAAQTLGAHGLLARSVEELQVTVGQGPSLEALTRDGAVLIAELDAASFQTRWPLFAPTAAAAGVGSMCVAPMGVGGARFGVFVVYLDRAELPGPRVVPAEVLTDVLVFAEIALDLLLDLAADIVRGGDDDLALGWFFDDHPAIHQATGMLSADLGVDMATAFVRLRAAAFADGLALSQVAQEVVCRTRSLEPD